MWLAHDMFADEAGLVFESLLWQSRSINSKAFLKHTVLFLLVTTFFF